MRWGWIDAKIHVLPSRKRGAGTLLVTTYREFGSRLSQRCTLENAEYFEYVDGSDGHTNWTGSSHGTLSGSLAREHVGA
jgi:hypothetical protein